MKKEIYLYENEDVIDIRRDNVFKAVFTKETPESRAALSALISALIDRKIIVIEILANEPPPDNINDRQIRFDINCRAENEELINVEMSFNPDKNEPVRLEFHSAKLFCGQGIRGKHITYNHLKLSYQVAILSEKAFFDDEAFLHSFEYYDPKNKISLSGRSRIITLELKKLNEAIKKSVQEMSVSERWAVYFEYLTDSGKRDIINEIINREEGINMASEALLKVSRDEHERARIMSEEKYQLDVQSRIGNAVQEATRKSKAEERQYFLELLNQGLSVEEIKLKLVIK